jgi:D-glucuronyl C5-epimerase C-terminus
MGEIRVSRRALLRSATVAAAGAGLVAAVPSTALASGRRKPPVLTLGGDAPGEPGAMLTDDLAAAALAPVELTVPASPAPLAAVTALPYKSFLRYDLQLRTLPPDLQPYALSTPTPLSFGTVDASGVRMVDRGGQLWNHPTAQAQYGMSMLESHRLTGDARYLAVAVKQATRLIGRAHAYGGGLFHPYDFPDSPHGTTVRTPPWYSGIAQGQVLDFFTRLAGRTGNLGYRTEADGTFRAFLVPQVARKPWVAWVHGGQLWLDEYPRTDIALGDRTYNGHMFSAFGLYQYYLLTHDERARQLAQGAFSTARAVGNEVRNPGWRSVYCLQDRVDAGNYHMTHSLQHRLISAITGEWSFAAVGDTLADDFPNPYVSGTVRFAAGTHVGYTIDAAGGVTGSRTITLTSSSTAPCSARTRLKGHVGLWYLITAGSFAGRHVQEVPGHAYLTGTCLAVSYLPYRMGLLSTAVPTAIQPAPSPGAAKPTKAVALSAHASVTIDQRMLIDAVPYLRIATGTNALWWIPAASVALLDAPPGPPGRRKPPA